MDTDGKAIANAALYTYNAAQHRKNNKSFMTMTPCPRKIFRLPGSYRPTRYNVMYACVECT